MSEDSVLFSTDLPDPSDYPELSSVGRIYEVAINGTGYMLADTRESEPDLRRERNVVSLDPPRLATTDTPFSEAIERYSFVGFSQFHAGAGQTRLDRPGSNGARYFDSDGVNPFELAELELLHAVTQDISSSYTNQLLSVAGDRLYVLDGAKSLKVLDTPGGSPASFTVAAATTIESLTSDGVYWYAGAGAAGIFRGTTSDPGAAWSSVAANVVGYAGRRICAAYAGAGSSTPNVFTTLNDSGLEEIPNGRYRLPANWTITSITGGDGHVWFGAKAGPVGHVYAWKVGSEAPFLALELPVGQTPKDLFYYQGQVMLRAETDRTGGDSKAWVYRAPTQDGILIPTLVAEIDGTGVDDGPGSFAADGRFVFFSWASMDGTNDGVGCIDLSTGGYAKWLKGPNGSGVGDLTYWKGRTVFSVNGQGVQVESLSTYVTSGWLKTSVSDMASGTDKVYDLVKVSCFPLTTGQTVGIDYTLDEGASYSALASASMSTAGQRYVEATLAKRASSIGLRVNLGGNGSSTPTLYFAQVQCHPIGKSDVVLQLPVNCADQVTGLNGALLPESGPGKGVARARALELLAQTRVKVQDVDWPDTQTSEIFEVLQARRVSRHVYDRHQAKNAVGEVVILTMRAVFR